MYQSFTKLSYMKPIVSEIKQEGNCIHQASKYFENFMGYFEEKIALIISLLGAFLKFSGAILYYCINI